MLKKYEYKEIAMVDSVKLCGSDTGQRGKERVSISLRIPRPASVGDKFASRYCHEHNFGLFAFLSRSFQWFLFSIQFIMHYFSRQI